MTELPTFKASSNSDVNIIGDHLILAEGKHTFCLDPSLLNLEVCSFIFIRLKNAKPISLQFENAVTTDQGQNIIEFVAGATSSSDGGGSCRAS